MDVKDKKLGTLLRDAAMPPDPKPAFLIENDAAHTARDKLVTALDRLRRTPNCSDLWDIVPHDDEDGGEASGYYATLSHGDLETTLVVNSFKTMDCTTAIILKKQAAEPVVLQFAPSHEMKTDRSALDHLIMRVRERYRPLTESAAEMLASLANGDPTLTFRDAVQDALYADPRMGVALQALGDEIKNPMLVISCETGEPTIKVIDGNGTPHYEMTRDQQPAPYETMPLFAFVTYDTNSGYDNFRIIPGIAIEPGNAVTPNVQGQGREILEFLKLSLDGHLPTSRN